VPKVLSWLALFTACLLAASGAPVSAAPPEVEALIKQLKDPNEVVRLKAAKELGKLKEKAKDAIPALAAATEDADEDVRTVAKRSLAAIKEVAGKVDAVEADEKLVPLIKDLKAKDNKTRLAAIAKLEEMGPDAKAAGAALVEFGMMSPAPAVKEAANAAFEKIDPLVFKEVVAVYYDENTVAKDRAVESLRLMGGKAKAAVPIIKGYHQYLVKGQGYTPGDTLRALVAIAPEDEWTQRVILDLVGGPENALPSLGRVASGMNLEIPSTTDREALIGLMHDLKIDDKFKAAPLVAGLSRATSSKDRLFMVAEISRLRLENKDKYTVLMAALKVAPERVPVINELARLRSDAKGALPVLKALKTDKEASVREAANAAIEAINE
jgi:hypothetical protein